MSTALFSVNVLEVSVTSPALLFIFIAPPLLAELLAKILFAARIINGEDPSTIPIENVVPRVLAVNKKILNTLKDPWTLSDELIQKADIVVDENGNEIKNIKN